MLRAVFKIIGATLLFAALHSFLASRSAKLAASNLAGVRARNGLYRPFFIAQSLLSFGLLSAYLSKLPDRILYRASKPLSWLLRLGQAAGIVYAFWAAKQVGLLDITGISSLLGWLRGDPQPMPEPEAQGPALNSQGELVVAGPFLHSRHPLNLAPLPVFWLNPVMSIRLLVFNLVASLYLIIGSLHEETRLQAAYGQVYEDYKQRDIPFYIPGL